MNIDFIHTGRGKKKETSAIITYNIHNIISDLSSSDLTAVHDVSSHAAEQFFGCSKFLLCSSNHKSQFGRTGSTNTWE